MAKSGPVERDPALVCVAVITGAQGLQGAVRVKSFTAVPEDAVSYGQISTANGERVFDVKLTRSTNKGLVVALSGVTTREEAESLRGTELYVSRDAFPPTDEDEFYYADLIGLTVEGLDGQVIGTVKSMDNYGAGEVMEVALESGAALILPFTKAAVPIVDVASGKIVADPPPELENSDEPDDEGEN